jgi:NAD(P)-dependent dehydrogenase (short-subunit alcohol dehydrogenase family)
LNAAEDLISMRGRRVLITGAAAGIGRAMAVRFAGAGAAVVLVDRDARALTAAARELSASGAEVTSEVADLADKEAIRALWQRLRTPPDTLINNAGIYPMADFLKGPDAVIEKTLAVNLEAVIWMCQRFIARRKKQGGVIINLSSVEAFVPITSGLVGYGASKAGVIAVTRSLARDYGKDGFRVNAIAPGAITTPGTTAVAQNAVRRGNMEELAKTAQEFQARLSLGRWGAPDDVARVALFLASDLAGYVHGALIPVDGGFLSS